MKHIFLLLLLLSISACTKEAPLENIYPFEGEKIVVNAYLISSEPIKVQITKTVSPYKFEPSAVNLPDAEVELYEDNIYIGNMIPDADNFYITAENIYPVVGKYYYFKVSHTELDDVETIPERIPVAVSADEVELIEDDGQLAVRFSFTDGTEDEAYSILISAIDTLGEIRSSLGNYGVFENNPALCGVYSSYFDDYCIDVESVTLNIDLFKNREYLNNENFDVLVRFYTLTTSCYEYEISRSRLEDFEGFGDPAILFSNVTNGYGAVVAYDLYTETIEL